MRGIVVVLLSLGTISCQPVVVSTEPIVGSAELEEMGLAGRWMPMQKPDDPFPPGEERLVSIVGPDESGAYCFVDNVDPKKEVNFTIERLPGEEHYCLADVVISDKSGGQKLHLPVYCWVKDGRLAFWDVSSEKLQQQLAEKKTDFSVESFGPFDIIKTDQHKFRDLLLRHGQLVVGEPNVLEAR